MNTTFKDINFAVETRGIRKIEENNSVGISVFGYENKENYPIYVPKNAVKTSILIYY